MCKRTPWKVENIILLFARHTASVPAPFPSLPTPEEETTARGAFAIFGMSLVQLRFDRPLCASRDSSVNDICGQAEGEQEGGATHTEPHGLSVIWEGTKPSLTGPGPGNRPKIGPDCVVQMTYKNLIFNNTNQFKNHQRHKNSFAGAYQEGGGRGGGGQTKSHFISHFGITARKVTKMKLLR